MTGPGSGSGVRGDSAGALTLGLLASGASRPLCVADGAAQQVPR